MSAESIAVGLSLWVGGAGLAACKGVAFLATGSPLVRASMFDSLGDVFSSFIMQITTWKIADTRDADRYPLGKERFQPLGVLFFCAFMTSTMSNMAIDSLQTLLSPSEDAPSGPTSEEAVRRLLDENPRLLWGYMPWARPSVDSLVSRYAGGVGEAGDGEGNLATILMVVCVVVKVLCWIYCKSVAKVTGSGVVAALSDDHRNDGLSNLIATVTMVLIGTLEARGVNGAILEKIDPAVALVLSVFIVYNWVSTALEQLKVLSDQRVEEGDAEDIEKAAKAALKGSSLRVVACHGLGVGEGCSVSLELAPVKGNAASQQVAASLGRMDRAVREASKELQVQEVHWRLRPDQSDEWVKDFAKP